MRRKSTALLVAALSLGITAHLSAEPNAVEDRATQQERATFEGLYQDKVRAALRTRDKEDDLELLDEMLSFAEEIPDDPGIRGLIYIQSIALAASGGDITTMIEAAELLDKVWPGHASASVDNLVRLADRAYRGAPRDEKDRVAKPYLDLLLISAEQAAEIKDYKSAIAHSRQAYQVARSMKSTLEADIDHLVDHYTAENATANRIQLLTKAVEQNNKNRPAARELVNLLLIKRNDPQAASIYVQHTGDPELEELVMLSAKGVANASAAQAVRVGDWYVILSEEQQKNEHALQMLSVARAWYARFLEVYPRKDTLASRVRSMDEVAKGRIDRMLEAGVGGIKKESILDKNSWTSLIEKPYDVTKYIIRGNDRVETKEGEISLQYATIAIPIKPGKAFELRLTISDSNTERFRPSFSLVLPTSTTEQNRSFVARYFPNSEDIIRLDDVDEESLLEKPPFRKDNKSVLTFQVATLDNGEIAFAMLADGKAAVKWQGPANEVNLDDPDEDEAKFGTSLILRSYATVVIHKAEYRER